MEFILSHVEQGVMTLTLNRPERLNSFNDVMHQQLAECLKQAERDDTVRVGEAVGPNAHAAARHAEGVTAWTRISGP